MSDQLNSSGPISLGGSTAGQSINLELDASATAARDMNEAAFRKLGGVVSSGSQISMSQFYGRSKYATVTFNPSWMGGSVLQKYIAGRITDGYNTQNFGNYSDALSGYSAGSFTFTFNTAAGRGLAISLAGCSGFGGGTETFACWVTGATEDAAVTSRVGLVNAGSGSISTTSNQIDATQRTQGTYATAANNDQFQLTWGFDDTNGGLPTSYIGKALNAKYISPTGATYTYTINLT